MSKNAIADAEDLLKRAGVDTRTSALVYEGLAADADLRKNLRMKLDRAHSVAEVIRAAAGERRKREGSETLAAPAALEAEEAAEPAFAHFVLESSIFSARWIEVLQRILNEPKASAAWTGAEDLFSIASASEQLLPKPLDTPERMSVAESIHGLGVLEALSKNWNADYIIAVNKGGAIVGNYIGRRLSLEQGNLGRITFKDQQVDLRAARKVLSGARNARVLIVDDISRTGRTLRSVHRALSEEFPETHFQSAALVSAVQVGPDTASLFGYAAGITSKVNVSLPWRTKGTFFVDQNLYFFGDRDFAIMDMQAEAIQRELLGAE